MKIGIIGAMEEEIKALREQLISPLSWNAAAHYLFQEVSAIMK